MDKRTLVYGERLMEDVQNIVDGDPRRVPADLDTFTLYRMAGNPDRYNRTSRVARQFFDQTKQKRLRRTGSDWLRFTPAYTG
jgi:hypothetical protein